ncbi:hypothetical protein HDV05_004872 [Chytridiales sp. JEL 0842]|nr:hypothetical protein HDV05_004872 [Chytridiales sp. JEL 0842]
MLLFWSPYTRGIPMPAWTLPHEIVGSNLVYLVTAIMIPMKKNPKAKYIMLTVMIIFNWLGENWMNYFLAGLMLADAREYGHLKRFQQWRYAHLTKFLLFFTTAPFAFTYWDNPVRKWAENFLGETIRINSHILMQREQWFPNATVIFPFIFACMLIVETSTWIQKVLSWRFFLFLGRISYMLYLSHVATVLVVADNIDAFIYRSSVPQWVSMSVTFVLLNALNLLVAWILTEMFDTPCLNLLRFWESVFLSEEKWSWGLMLDWCRGKYERTVVDFKTKAVKLRKAGSLKRWRRKKVVRLSENVSPLPVGASEMTIEQEVEVEVVEVGNQEPSRNLSTTHQ